MGEFDGVGRVYRSDLNPHPERPPQVDRAERDRRGKGGDPDHPGEEPHDTVELHEEPGDHQDKAKAPKPKDRKLDISA
jgi:hypothetical protein